jgi:hypothetical protein
MADTELQRELDVLQYDASRARAALAERDTTRHMFIAAILSQPGQSLRVEQRALAASSLYTLEQTRDLQRDEFVFRAVRKP